MNVLCFTFIVSYLDNSRQISTVLIQIDSALQLYVLFGVYRRQHRTYGSLIFFGIWCSITSHAATCRFKFACFVCIFHVVPKGKLERLLREVIRVKMQCMYTQEFFLKTLNVARQKILCEYPRKLSSFDELIEVLMHLQMLGTVAVAPFLLRNDILFQIFRFHRNSNSISQIL